MASFNHTSALEQPHDLAQRRSWVDSGPYWQDREARLGVRVGEPHNSPFCYCKWSARVSALNCVGHFALRL
jgi:hypothetical protein